MPNLHKKSWKLSNPGGGKIELPNSSGSGPTMLDSNHLFAAAAAAAMEQVAAASKLGKSFMSSISQSWNFFKNGNYFHSK